MAKLLEILSNIWSVVLYPMFMPFYGILLFCGAIQKELPQLPIAYLLICILGTIIFTIAIPITIIYILKRKGHIDTIYIDNPKQRTIPYIYTLICYGFWAYFLRFTLHLPTFIFIVAIGAIFALLAVTIINRWWKISAHLTGIGGLLGGIFSYAINYSNISMLLVILVLISSLLLMYARLYLNAHSPLQVVCGFILGIISTFIPTLIFSYA